MPTDIHTILLLPRDPAMLADGPGGSSPPVMHRRPEPPGMDLLPMPFGPPPEWGLGPKGYATDHALLLAHDGKVVEQARGWLPGHGPSPDIPGSVTWAELIERALRGDYGVSRLRTFAASCDLGAVVLLDKSGREVTL